MERISNNQPIRESRVLLGTNYQIEKYGFKQLLYEQRSRFKIAEVAYSLRQANEMIQSSQPEVFLVDLFFGGFPNFYFMKDTAAAYPKLPIVVYSNWSKQTFNSYCKKAGVWDYMQIQTGKELDLDSRLKEILAKEKACSKVQLEVSVESASSRLEPYLCPQRYLTAREIQVYYLLGQGVSKKKTVQLLHISSKTLETHLAHIADKLISQPPGVLLKNLAMRWVAEHSGRRV